MKSILVTKGVGGWWKAGLAGLLVVQSACVSLHQEPAPQAPKLTMQTPTNAAIDAAVLHGGELTEQAKKIITRRKDWVNATAHLHQLVTDAGGRLDAASLIQAMNLYQASPLPAKPEVFSALIKLDQPLTRQLAWQLAAIKPSPDMAQVADKELSQALIDDDLDRLLLPEVASAVLANNLSGSYSIVRQGLMVKGNEEFARAMVFLDPKQASHDLMTYLSLAPVEELRQLTLKTVNMYAAMLALRHFQNFPVSTAHPNFNHLYLYAVSRNTALAELAQDVVELYLPDHKEDMAFHLSRLPPWIQVAYLENARRRANPKVRVLVGELSKFASQAAVLDEIRSFR